MIKHRFIQILFIIAVIYLVTIPAVRYWIWEVGASLLIDAFVYLFLPLFVLGILLAIVRNLNAVMKELKQILLDTMQFFR